MSVQQWEQRTNRFHLIPPSILQRYHYRKLRLTACSHCCVSQDGGTSGQDGGTSDPDFRSVTRRSNVYSRGTTQVENESFNIIFLLMSVAFILHTATSDSYSLCTVWISPSIERLWKLNFSLMSAGSQRESSTWLSLQYRFLVRSLSHSHSLSVIEPLRSLN